MQCPVCDDEKLVISSRDGVEIDYCPQCRGVWLDRGELDKIIDRVAGSGGVGPPSAPPPQERPTFDDRRPDDRDGKRRKRRSFLDDIFDFD